MKACILRTCGFLHQWAPNLSLSVVIQPLCKNDTNTIAVVPWHTGPVKEEDVIFGHLAFSLDE